MTDSFMRWMVGTVALACAVGFGAPGVKAAPSPCDQLSAAEVQQLLGRAGQVKDSKPNSCLWMTEGERMLSISVDPAFFPDPKKQLDIIRNLAQRRSPKHTFQDEPAVGPLAFSETTTIKEWLVRFVKGNTVVVIRVDGAPGKLDAARAAAKLLYAKM